MTLPRVYCPRCGIENGDDADTCVSCGNDLRTWRGNQGTSQQPAVQQSGYPLPPQQPQQPYYGPPGQAIPNYLVQSILVTLCCCLPAGIPAIVFAAQVNSKLQAGDVNGALNSSKNARTWCWVSFGLGIAAVIVQFLLVAVGAIGESV